MTRKKKPKTQIARRKPAVQRDTVRSKAKLRASSRKRVSAAKPAVSATAQLDSRAAAPAAAPAPSAAAQAPVSEHLPPSRYPPRVASQPKFPPAILLMGPTASGKSAMAMMLAQRLPCEIISVDSAQVYKGMNIGTAKPDARALAAVPHHLIDILEPYESYSAARFRDDALTLMREITERDRIPLLAGGTMLYFLALTEGLNDLPEADPAIRLVIDTMADDEGWPAVHAKLQQVDPETAARIDPNDAQRVQRAFEIYLITNKPMSEFLKRPKYVYFPYAPIKVALIPSDREVLHERIAERFDGMIESGLIDELQKLREEYGLEPDMPSMRAVGYRQVWEYLSGRIGMETLREQAIAATRQLAKRQLTWLRSMKDVTEFDCLAEDLPNMILEYIRRELEAQLASV